MNEVLKKLNLNGTSVRDETVRILLKVAENIITNPENVKLRCLPKSNATFQNKILATKGGLECLKLMGFEETDSTYVLPDSSPMSQLVDVRQALLSFKTNDVTKGAIPKTKVSKNSIKENGDFDDENADLKYVKRFVLPPLKLKFSNPFLRQIESQFHQALAFGDQSCQQRAKKLIPLNKLQITAQKNLRFVQQKIKKEKMIDPEFSLQDMLLMELLTWFKEEFFSWVDKPSCEFCGGKTHLSHMSTDDEDLIYTKRVEVYKCEGCSKVTKFPRYNDLNLLLETRRGRCGEWAQVFTLMCQSLGWDARYVVDEQDHVWTEVYSMTRQRWVHCDSCENACDTPLMYECGWNKKLTYCIAYSPLEVQDVTWRYSSNHKETIKRRKNCTEDELIQALISLRRDRQDSFTAIKQNYLTKRIIQELIEMMEEKQPHNSEKHGRISGSQDWRLARGEVRSENMYVWVIADNTIFNNKVTIKYSTALNKYQFVKGMRQIGVNDWNFGVFEFKNIFRKEETDWKTVYLARTEGSNEGSISWRFELEPGSKKVIHSISLHFDSKTYETGEVGVRLVSDSILLPFPKSDNNLTTSEFSGLKHFSIEAVLKGGAGDVAWQHAQLFRQANDSTEYPFVITITFK